MWLVLCMPDDLAALWVARGLYARGLQTLQVVTAEALAYNQRLEHRLVDGRASVKITLADGRVIDSATVRGTLNRLQLVPGAHLRTNSKDRQYAEQELYALYLSWLHSLPGEMLNRPTPLGLCGEWRHPSEWVWLANQAGLETEPYGQSEFRGAPPLRMSVNLPDHTVIVVDSVCCGSPAPQNIEAGCTRLAKLSTTRLLGVGFNVSPSGKWMFREATPFPELRLGGNKLQDALFQVLTS